MPNAQYSKQFDVFDINNIQKPLNIIQMKKILILLITVVGFVINSTAQSTATATATATVITPITISKNSDMSFGNVSVQSGTGGSVILAPNGTRTRTAGVTLPAVTGSVSAASFTVNGEGSYTYDISLPSTVTLTHSGGVQTMAANSFISNPSGTGQLASGSQNIAVGATLTVSAGQLSGVYTSTTFNVTVNYN